MPNELKPCPFCGKPVHFIYNSFDDVFKFSHKYCEDAANCSVVSEIWIKANSLSEARGYWNERY